MDSKDRQNQDSKQAEGQAYGIDLGLGSLLKPEAEISTLKDKSTLLNVPEPTDIIADTEYQFLYEQKRFSDIVSISETRLEHSETKDKETSSWIESQAWWLIGQVKLESFPASILEAPFESLIEVLKNNPVNLPAHITKCCSLALSTYLEALAKEDNLKNAVHLISGMTELLENDSFNQEIRVLVQSFSDQADLLNSEDKHVLSELRLKLRLTRLSDARKQIPQAALTDQIAADSFGSGTTSQKTKRRGYTVFCLFLFLVAVIASVFWYSYSSVKSQELISLLKSKVQSPNLKIEVPKPEMSSEFSELDAMLYEVNKKLENPPAEILAARSTPFGSVAETAKAVETPVVEKAKINTSEPKESEALKKLRTEKPVQSEPDPIEQEPSLVPGPALAPQFKEYPTLRMFEVIRPTSLMSQPSTRSEAVAGLNKGDLVQVEAKEGYWFRIVSKKGKVAYVIAEDLQPSY